jgi:hypothetical protein
MLKAIVTFLFLTSKKISSYFVQIENQVQIDFEENQYSYCQELLNFFFEYLRIENEYRHTRGNEEVRRKNQKIKSTCF